MIVQPTRRIILVDTNALIELGIWHPIKNCTSFWKQFEAALKKGDWVLTNEVVDEIGGIYQPELKKWCDAQIKSGLVKNISDDNRTRGYEINKLYPMINATTHNSTVDTFLIAFAEEHGLEIFTRESPRRDTTQPYKIPDTCNLLHITWLREPDKFFDAIGIKI